MTDEELRTTVKRFGVRPQGRTAMIEFVKRVQSQISVGENESGDPPAPVSTICDGDDYDGDEEKRINTSRDSMISTVIKSEREMFQQINQCERMSFTTSKQRNENQNDKTQIIFESKFHCFHLTIFFDI